MSVIKKNQMMAVIPLVSKVLQRAITNIISTHLARGL